MNFKLLRPFLISAAVLLLALLMSVAIGPVFVPPGTVVGVLLAQIPGLALPGDWPEYVQTIVFQIRLPHALLMALTGAALAGSGAAFQGLFRNPLADPYLIGVASGAGLGAVFALAADWPSSLLGMYTVPAAAFLGAIVTVALVYWLARVGRTLPTTTLILAGVAISAFAGSLTSFLMLRSNEELRRALSWLLGGSVLDGWGPFWAALPYVLVGLGFLTLSGHSLNLLQYGEEQAQQLGLNTERAKLLLILAASLATAAAVAFAGIIGFIGLVVPHSVRLLWGGAPYEAHDYRRLVPLSILGGSIVLLAADLLARMLLAPQVLPVGIITALAGAPFFLYLLRRAKDQAFW